MRHEFRPTRATSEGQAIAFVEALTALKGKRRVAARLAAGTALAAGGVALVFGASKALPGAFG
ncbi:MAG: hypothetical protein H7233_11840 [Pseudorhodobacter sp.]|nr:hypothetical protein [Frankiaceae bacterium]